MGKAAKNVNFVMINVSSEQGSRNAFCTQNTARNIPFARKEKSIIL